MKTFHAHRSFFRLGCVFSFLLMSAAVSHAQVALTSGSVVTTGEGTNNTMAIYGPNFSLQASFLDFTLLGVIPSPGTVTFIPAQSFSQSGAGNVIYNGVNNYLFIVRMNFTAAPVTVPNTITAPGGPVGFYSGTVSNVAFTMTGTVTTYTDTVGGTVGQVIPISGQGVYKASAAGELHPQGPGGVPSQLVTYQFTSSAAFVADTTTQGAWSTNYGGDGFQIANGVSQLPSYASLSFPGASTYTWAAKTADVRALQNGPGSANRIASAYVNNYGNSFNIDLNMTGGGLHRVALYLLDWDSSSRVETVTITNAETNAVIDTETFSKFENGEYAAWNLSGNVNIQVTRVSGGSPVVSGIFFGPSGTPPLMSSPDGASAYFEGFNAEIPNNFDVQGAWTFGYGTAGYLIADGPTMLPSDSQVSVTGDFIYTWAAQTSDTRALRSNPYSPPGVAAAFTQYMGQSFNINVNIPSPAGHAVSLYILDWDSNTRQETVTIRDASTNALLSTETFANFSNGYYATWGIQGNVVITVTPVGNTTPVVSGIFFN